MRKPKLMVPESNPVIKPNLDPKCLKIPEEGWAAEDRAKKLLDVWNAYSKKSKPWEYSEFVKQIYPSLGTHDFVEGFLLASLYMAEVVSGGYVRDHIKKKDSNQGVLDALMLQRFLDWVEIHKEVQP